MGKLDCKDDVSDLIKMANAASKGTKTLMSDLEGTAEEYNKGAKYFKEGSAANNGKRAEYLREHGGTVYARSRSIKGDVATLKKSLDDFDSKIGKFKKKVLEFVSDIGKKSKGGNKNDQKRIDKSCQGVVAWVEDAENQIRTARASIKITEPLLDTFEALGNAMAKITAEFLDRAEQEEKLRNLAKSFLHL